MGLVTVLRVALKIAGATLLAMLRVALEITGATLLAKWMTTELPDDRRGEAPEKPEPCRTDCDGRGDDRIPKKSGDAHQNCVTKMIKIMTYNIWSYEDMQLKERINAIGRLVEKHSPNVIFFQEVTHVILEIFQSFEWWKVYEHSILPNKKEKGHFCMLLCKLPVKSSGCMRFENSTLGRDLYTASIKVGRGKKLVVATTHFKSPNPPEMHCLERKAQAKKALGYLDDFSNVVFGGDMNWDEHTDGPLPLRNGWVDAWAQLRPGENGWTFDTRSNPMLQGRKLLQKRLDRFLCKLKDFELVRVEIIGKEAIPGILCYDNMRNMIVPALPSDHYGLLLTVSCVTRV